MKITFDNAYTNRNVDKVVTSYQETRTGTERPAGGYALDISGTVMDNNAYKGHGMTAEEVMQAAGQVDLAVQRDFMTVMSNSMSKEDYSKMMEEGYHPADIELDEVVTIVDKIKAELVKGGTQVAGYTDQLDMETLREITGSEAFETELCKQFAAYDVPVTEENAREAKKAYDEASSIDKITEGAKKYMIENRKEPTIDNLYRADYSSMPDSDRQGKGYYAEELPGYYTKKAEDYHWEQLKPQMEKVIEQAELPVDEETLGQAKWLVEKGVPLTEDTLTLKHQLDALEWPQDQEQILSAIAAAVSEGRRPGEADLTDSESSWEKAADYAERFAGIDEEAVDRAAAEEKALTLQNIESAAAQNRKEQNTAADRGRTYTAPAIEELNPENVTARRRLEEIRLMMTIEANYKLLESGYKIDTMELEQLVEALKKIEAENNAKLFKVADEAAAAQKAAIYTETRTKLEEIPYMPAAVAGRFRVSSEDFTLNQVHIEGSALRSAYEEAGEKYEQLMTAPRADMGDSIRKAFRNVDDILEDMDLELTEANRRAVRILGYNRMELTFENIQAVKESDQVLRRAVTKLTPAATLQMIREGVNPLNMPMEELNDYLDDMPYDEEQDAEKYSKFLYNLEQHQGIEKEERDAYIGVYRMLRQLEKSDDAAVGSLLQSGEELSFGNLLRAARSTKRRNMDYKVGDDFGGVNGIAKNVSITEQIGNGISAYERRLAGEAADHLTPEKLVQLDTEEDVSLERFTEQLIQAKESEAETEAGEAYIAEQLQEYRNLGQVDDTVILELLQGNQPVTVNRLAAADALMNQKGFLFRKLNELTKEADKDKIRQAAAKLQDKMTDKESAGKAYGEMQQAMEEVLEEARFDTGVGYLDLKAIRSCQKQLALAGSLAREENYQIPVSINGETTAIHLKVIHGSGESGMVKASLQTESYGDVTAQFSVGNGTITGYLACSTKEGVQAMQEKEDALQTELMNRVEELTTEQLKLGKISVIHSAELSPGSFMTQDPPQEGAVESTDLYQIAKAFITVVTA